jgi:ribonuclease BN (tRNA processing enzyme)
VELVVLGNGAAYAGPGQACSGYLIRDRDTGLMIDCGNGVVSKLLQAGEEDNVTALLFSHLHADHCLDIFSLFYQRVYSKDKHYPRIPIYLPPGEADRFARLAEVLRVEPKELFEKAFDPVEYDPEAGLMVSDLRILFSLNEHPVPTYAIRVERNGASLVYSSDTGPQPELEQLAHGCDLLLSEATLGEADFDPTRPIHLTPRLAGEVAARAGAKRLLLTHIWPFYDRTAMLEDARQLFPSTELAEELRRYHVG